MAWSLAHHRIFNARHVLATVLHRITVVGILAVLAWALASGLAGLFEPEAAWIISIFIGGIGVFWLDQKSRNWIGLSDELLLAAFRSEVIHVSRTEAGANRITAAFETLLAAHHQARFAVILGRQGDKYVGNGIEFSPARRGFTTLCEQVWITPESLQRRRATAGLDDLGDFLGANALGVLVTVPRGSPAPTMIVGVGVKKNEWPYTYPEVRRLQNVAELMDSILTRTRLADQVAMQARMEHLAMMSRGLAHDLKNLITPISSFLVHTDGRFAPGSAEAEVHAAARRSTRIITEYIREALFFSERMAPKLDIVDLPRILEAVREVSGPRAIHREVSLATEIGPLPPITADGVLLQRMLVNLVNNAIDASQAGKTVRLAALTVQAGWLRLQVSDEGSGIAPELLDRIFEPYFTTKEFGDDVRGFGLGLTIAQKIAQLHGGGITVQSEAGRGTVMTIDLPEVPSLPGAPAA